MSSGARQWTEWLSPSSATVGATPGAPNVHAGGTLAGTGVHGELVCSGASCGVGVTFRRSVGLEHGAEARAAAPKQRGGWRAVIAATSASSSTAFIHATVANIRAAS